MHALAVVALCALSASVQPPAKDAAGAPPAQERKPVMVMPPQVEASNPRLAQELQRLFASDQGVRARIPKLGIEHGLPLPEPFLDEWRRIDEENLRDLRRLVDEHGWPSTAAAGTQGAMAAFLVIQHADLTTQKEFLPILRAAAERGDMSASQLAYLEDRVRIRGGQPQIYGTQLGLDAAGKVIAENLEDPEGVDARRAKVGLPPLDVYLRMASQGRERSGATAGEPPTDPALRDELNAMRMQWNTIGPERFGDGVTRDESTWPDEVRARRVEARGRLERLLERAMAGGYPTAAVVGEDGSRAFFSMLADAGPELQERALPLLGRAAERGDGSRAQLAWLTDRVRTRRGETQIYGTQFRRDDSGEVVALPLEDAAGVDKRREGAGLPPLRETLDVLNGRGQEEAAPQRVIVR